MVLGGDDTGDRILKAAQLAQAGWAPDVFVDGPKALIGYESDLTVRYAIEKGYPASLFKPLQLPRNIDSTRTETAYVGKYLTTHGIQKVLLVTSNFHTHRAAYLMRKQNPKMQVEVVAAPDPYFTPGTWWESREGQKTFVMEWMKTVATWLGI